MIIVLMGVSGSGKTAVGKLLAARLGWPFCDGDDFHPRANVEKMRRGDALTDDDREPWLSLLRGKMEEATRRGGSMVLACSALREAYRERLRQAGGELRFVHLRGDRGLVRRRLAERRGHFFSPGLLESQYDALEEPEDAVSVDISGEPGAVVEAIARALDL